MLGAACVNLGIRCFLLPIQLQVALSEYSLANCSAIMQNFKTTLGVLQNESSPLCRSWFSLWTLADSQEQNSCWTKQDFNVGNLGKEKLKSRLPDFLGTWPVSCWNVLILMNMWFFPIHTRKLNWSTSSEMSWWINRSLLAYHAKFLQRCCGGFTQVGSRLRQTQRRWLSVKYLLSILEHRNGLSTGTLVRENK